MTISFPDAEIARDDWLLRTRLRLQMAQSSNEEKGTIWQMINGKKRNASMLGSLQTLCTTPGMASCLSETIFAQEEP